MAQPSPGHGATSRAVSEALAAFAAPGLCGEMLSLALSVASLQVVPEDVVELQRFLDGPLRTVVAGYLGDDAADAVAEDLAPLLMMLKSQVRPSSRADREDVSEVRRTPTPMPSLGPPMVLLATLDGPRLRGLTRGLEGVASVRLAEHVFALASALDARPHRLPLVVIDLAAAPFDGAGLGALAPLLPSGARIVLWGDPRRFEKAIERLRRAGVELVSCPAGVTIAELANVCSVLVGA